MDVNWFKSRQKALGVTAEDIAREMGRARSGVSHIYSGHQRMSLDWARAFAKVLKVPLDDVLKHAGVNDADEPAQLRPGLSEGDAAPYRAGGGAGDRNARIAALMGGDRPGVDVWTVRTNALQLAGYAPGDMILVDTHQSERCRAGDDVVAQVYNWQADRADTILRRYEPPVLLPLTADAAATRVHVVDGANVVIRGKVIALWRAPAGRPNRDPD